VRRGSLCGSDDTGAPLLILARPLPLNLSFLTRLRWPPLRWYLLDIVPSVSRSEG